MYNGYCILVHITFAKTKRKTCKNRIFCLLYVFDGKCGLFHFMSRQIELVIRWRNVHDAWSRFQVRINRRWKLRINSARPRRAARSIGLHIQVISWDACLRLQHSEWRNISHKLLNGLRALTEIYSLLSR